MEAELLERVESSQKQANHVVEIYECLKSTVDQLKAEVDSGVGEIKRGIQDEIAVMEIFIWEEFIESVFACTTHKTVILLVLLLFPEGSLWQAASKLNSLLTSENKRLQQLTEDLKQKHSHMTSEVQTAYSFYVRLEVKPFLAVYKSAIFENSWDCCILFYCYVIRDCLFVREFRHFEKLLNRNILLLLIIIR